MQFTTLFCDLDDTLYPASSGLWAAIKERINLYMHERVGIPWQDIPRLRESYFRMYGTTLKGLEANHPIDRDEYLAFVHDLPLRDFIEPNPDLRPALSALPTRNLILTNADAAHARRVLTVLDVSDCFTDIFDVNTTRPYCKPQPEALQIALEAAGESDPTRCVLIDDQPRTTQAARQFGFYTILYGTDRPTTEADAVMQDWRELPGLLEGGRS